MKIIMISGKQGSGKTTTADMLAQALRDRGRTVVRTRFAKPLYEAHDAVLKVLQGYGVERPKKDSRLLQLLGTEYGRETIHPDIWVSMMVNGLDRTLSDYVIIDDLRFKNEFRLADYNQNDILRVRLEANRNTRKDRCDGWRETEDHPSETDLDDMIKDFDLVVRTDSHLSTRQIVDVIINSLPTK